MTNLELHADVRLRRFKCSVCGEYQGATGGSHYFRCTNCRQNTYGNGCQRAMNQVGLAVRRGELAPAKTLSCADCGSQASEYDHRDYNFPLIVEPVCRSCNLLRGPAIPRKGFFAEALVNGKGLYSNRIQMERLFRVMGLEVDVSHIPRRTTLEHWRLFTDHLLAWESTTDQAAA